MVNRYKLKKSKLTDEASLEQISKHLQEEPAEEASSDDDEAPEEVGFGASKDLALGELKQIQETIKEIKATKKRKRKTQQEKNEKQKNEKLKDLDKLPDSLLQNLSNEPEDKPESPDFPEDEDEADESKSENIGDTPENEDDESFIPLKRRRKKKTKSGIKVVALEKTNPHPTIPAVSFREQMLYGKNVKRHSATTLYSNLKKLRTKH